MQPDGSFSLFGDTWHHTRERLQQWSTSETATPSLWRLRQFLITTCRSRQRENLKVEKERNNFQVWTATCRIREKEKIWRSRKNETIFKFQWKPAGWDKEKIICSSQQNLSLATRWPYEDSKVAVVRVYIRHFGINLYPCLESICIHVKINWEIMEN